MPRRAAARVTKRCACPRRGWAKCPHPWHFSFCHGKTPEGRPAQYRFSLAPFATTADGSMTKSDADAIADQLCAEIRRGDRTTTGARVGAVPAPQPLTLDDVAAVYRRQFIDVPTRRPRAAAHLHGLITRLCEADIPRAEGQTQRLGAVVFGAITRADLEAAFASRRDALARAQAAAAQVRAWEAAPVTTRPPLPAGIRSLAAVATRSTKDGLAGLNRLKARARHLFNWAVLQGYRDETPFKRHGVSAIRVDAAAEGGRTRRLRPGEEARLREAASPHLRALLEAALSTGCRIGELLSLQWAQVERDAAGVARTLILPAAKTKTAATRVIPVGQRLRAVLDMREAALRTRLTEGLEAVDAARLARQIAAAYVFGNELGERIASVKTAWRSLCQRVGADDLHFHDLRREFACRLLESRAELHDVRDFLGHANITTTSRYLQSSPVRLAKVLDQLEATFHTRFAHEPPAEGPEGGEDIAEGAESGGNSGGPCWDRTSDQLLKRRG